MADKQVALIRGINVGRAKRVAMSDLRVIVTELGYSSVCTLLNSGNVVFVAPDTDTLTSATCIEEVLLTRLGVSARVIVLTAEELATVVADNPLVGVADDPTRLLVTVLANQADRARLEPLAEQDWAPEVLATGERVAYLWCPEGVLASRLAKAVGKVLGDAVTTRNWATVMKLHALAEK